MTLAPPSQTPYPALLRARARPPRESQSSAKDLLPTPRHSFIFVHLSVLLSVVYACMHPSIHPPPTIHPSAIHPSIHPPPSIHPSCLSAHSSVCLHVSICLCVPTFVSLSSCSLSIHPCARLSALSYSTHSARSPGQALHWAPGMYLERGVVTGPRNPFSGRVALACPTGVFPPPPFRKKWTNGTEIEFGAQRGDIAESLVRVGRL